MSVLIPQSIGIGGLGAVYTAAAAGGDQVNPGDRTFLHVKATTTAITVTVVVPGNEYGVARADVPVAIAAGADRFIGPMARDLADPTTGHVGVTYSAVTGVTIAALTL